MTRIHLFLLNLILALAVGGFIFIASPVQAASYTANKLADDASFINTNAASVNQIQAILRSNGSFLKNYSEKGRTAAQIIYDAARVHGDASASVGRPCRRHR